MVTKIDGKLVGQATQAGETTIINNTNSLISSTSSISANVSTVSTNVSKVVSARRTVRYYTSEVNSQDVGNGGDWGPFYCPDVDLPPNHTVHHAWLILEGVLVDISGAPNHFTAGYIQIHKVPGAFYGATQITRCPYEIPANGAVAIKVTANVGPTGGLVPATNANGTYGFRLHSINTVGGAGNLLFNGHWILEIEYTV